MRSALPRSLAIIGTGLIGTSVGLALRTARRAGKQIRVTGWDSRATALAAAKRRGGITHIATSFEEAVADADIIVLAAPLDAVVAMLPRVIAKAAPGALILDVTAVKQPIIAAARSASRRRPDIDLISGHPMAGRERAGAAAAVADLFRGRPFALVAPYRNAAGRSRAESFVRALGAIPVWLPAAVHDRTVAATSALPQLAAIALALATQTAAGKNAARLAGPGYNDATRLASSPYAVWEPVIKANRANIVRAMRSFERALGQVVRAASQADARDLERLFSQAARARRRVVGG